MSKITFTFYGPVYAKERGHPSIKLVSVFGSCLSDSPFLYYRHNPKDVYSIEKKINKQGHISLQVRAQVFSGENTYFKSIVKKEIELVEISNTLSQNVPTLFNVRTKEIVEFNSFTRLHKPYSSKFPFFVAEKDIYAEKEENHYFYTVVKAAASLSAQIIDTTNYSARFLSAPWKTDTASYLAKEMLTQLVCNYHDTPHIQHIGIKHLTFKFKKLTKTSVYSNLNFSKLNDLASTLSGVFYKTKDKEWSETKTHYTLSDVIENGLDIIRDAAIFLQKPLEIEIDCMLDKINQIVISSAGKVTVELISGMSQISYSELEEILGSDEFYLVYNK